MEWTKIINQSNQELNQGNPKITNPNGKIRTHYGQGSSSKKNQ